MDMAVRTGAWSPSGAPLPYDAEVEYLQSTGTQCIETTYYASFNASIECCFANNSNETYKSVFGTTLTKATVGNRYQLTCQMVSGGLRYDYPYGNDPNKNSQYDAFTYPLYSTSSRDFVTIKISPEGCYFNGALVGTFSRTRPIARFLSPLYVFALGTIDQAQYRKKYGQTIRAKIKYVIVKESDVVVLHLIPIRFTNENGVSEGAMYDRVSGQLFRNAGTGAFIIGPDKTT